MSIDTNFNVNPYYDDYDEDKKFLRMLFKPGYAVQARELTQAQTILQKQIERFGNHVFKNGSVVSGGATFLQDVTYLKLDTDYAGSSVVANNFIGTTIVDNVSVPTKRAEVVKVYDADSGTGDPKTLLIKQIYGDAFVAGDTILTYQSSPTGANVATSGVGTGQIFSVTEGVYYYDGYFIKNDQQTIATSKYNNATANARIGFEITESTVSSSTDTSLLDPAQNASNYQAPGADRFKVNLVLATRSLTSTDTTQFIELARVESGVLTRNNRNPVYSVLEETFARRTYDESGNYTVKPFKVALETNSSNTANVDVILSPGKAYVFGYEYESIAPERLTVEKPRDTSAVANKRLTGDYGNFLYTTNHVGSQAINDLSTIDLHCVNSASINVTSAGTISNTKIGTARVISLSYDSSSNTSDSSTYVYKSFLFDVNVNNSVTGNVNVATSTTVTIGNTAAGEIFSSVNDAYVGATFKITTGPGSTEDPRYITDFDATTQTITLSQAYVATLNTASQFSIDFEVSEAESLATHSGTTVVNSSDVSSRSKDAASTYNDTFLTDAAQQPPIVELGDYYIAGSSIADFSYSYRRLYTGQTFTANVSPALSVGSGESLASGSTSTSKLTNYQVVVTSAGTSPYSVGDVISVDKITNVDTVTRKITVDDGQNMTANIIATIDFTLASGSPAKTKTLVTANSTVQTTGGESINANGIIVYSSQGQTRIEANNVIKTVDTPQSLYVSDVTSLISVYDFNGAAIANTGYTDVTYKYTLDKGQRDSFYNHASIKLKTGYSAPNGPLVVRYNKYSSSGAGFFTVDSYPTYGTIPTYTSSAASTTYELRDCIDFRPVRKDATAAIGTAVQFDVDSSTTGPKVVENGSDIILDYSYYLARVDKVVLNKNRTFEIIKGNPAVNPVRPKDKDDAMTLYILSHPAYLADPDESNVKYIDNRRYTMRDIGNIDKRVGNLEYYTSLSLLEQDAFNKSDLTILDSTNLPRFKNGIVVDAFRGHSVADVTNPDYLTSIDVNEQEARPTFNVLSYTMTFDSANSTNFLQEGSFVTVPASSSTFVAQDLASKTMNINPFNVVNYLGKIKLEPPSDTWVDTEKQPDVLVNLNGDKDAWDFLLGLDEDATTTITSNDNWGGGALKAEGFFFKDFGTFRYRGAASMFPLYQPKPPAGILWNSGLAPEAIVEKEELPAGAFKTSLGLGSITIEIEGGGGTGATAEASAFLQPSAIYSQISEITLTNPGQGYTSPPRIRIRQSGSGTPPRVANADWNAVAQYDGSFIDRGSVSNTTNTQRSRTFSVEWDNWETIWTGVETETNVTVKHGHWIDGPKHGRGNVRSGNSGTRTTTTTTTEQQTRSGIATQLSLDSITQSLGDRVVDVSVIPYMRKVSILFTATDFKPDTILYPFFDNTTVEKYVARANELVLENNNLSYNVRTGQQETIKIYNNNLLGVNAIATGIHSSNNILYIVSEDLAYEANTDTMHTIEPMNCNAVGNITATSVKVTAYNHYSGFANTATANTIILSDNVEHANNVGYYGNTANSNIITIVNGTGVGQQRSISSYNHSTKTITISTDWDTIPDAASEYTIGRITTSRGGDAAGILHLPPRTFRTGEKLFRLIDDSAGDIPSSSTNGDASFYAQGILQKTEELSVSTISPTIQRTSVSDERVTTTVSSQSEPVAGWYDPLAQTFLVSPAQHKQGIMLDRVRVCFKTKDESVPVTLQLRPTVNGYPSSTVIYPYGSVTLTPDKVKTTDSPDFDDATKYTDFIFDTPVYLTPGEHAFVLVSNCNSYEAYVAEVGKLDLVSGLQISEQPYGGSFFMSQNGSTWEADQNLDIAFRLFKKTYDTSSPAIVEFDIPVPSNANVEYDMINFTTSEVTMANTSLSYSFNTVKTTGGFTGYLPIRSSKNYYMNDGYGRRVVTPSITSVSSAIKLRATLSTVDPDVSPFVDVNRFSSLIVQNTINNLPLHSHNFVIEAGGSGYANTADITVTISGGGGSGATATANVVSNTVVGIDITNGGSGYTTSPTVTLTPGSGGGSGAVVTVNGEDKKSGGNSKVRYMTRRVTLADGFDSGDLRLYITAYKPGTSNIYAYYKVLSASDADSFEDKNWTLMTELGNPNFASTTDRDWRELTFAPGADQTQTNAITYTDGSVTYNSFKTFAIKVVMSGSDTTDVPRIQDLRLIALPAEA